MARPGQNGPVVSAPVVICDPGVDDFLALAVLAGADCMPRGVVGTAGNVNADVAAQNAARIVALLDLDCPVAKGSVRAMAGPYPDTGEPFHGADGLGGIAPLLPEGSQADMPPSPLTLIDGSLLATGALTVVAEAITAGRPISEITWMGGAVACGGNMTPSAEFNAWLDPEAADLVLSGTVPLAVVPLDVTQLVPLMPEDVVTIASLGDVGALAARALSHFHVQGREIFPHDAVAAVAHLEPELFRWEERWVRCELKGFWTRGMTVVDRRHHGERGRVRVAVDIDRAAVKDRMFTALGSLRSS